MAERQFDYSAIQSAYDELKNKFDVISENLTNMNTDYESYVNQECMAIYGDLGSQMLLNWDNVSSDFPKFLDNFDNWSNAIATAGGNYAQFESDIAGFKNLDGDGNYLGVSAQQNANGAIRTNFIESSNIKNYSDSVIDQFNEDANNLSALHEIPDYYYDTGAVYAVADSQSILKRHKTTSTIATILGCVGVAYLAVGGTALLLTKAGIIGASSAAGTEAAATGTGAAVEAGTGAAVEAGTGAAVEAGTGAAVEAGTGAAVEAGTGAAVEAGTGATKTNAFKTAISKIGAKFTDTKVGKKVANSTFGKNVAKGGVKGVVKQVGGVTAIYEAGKISGIKQKSN